MTFVFVLLVLEQGELDSGTIRLIHYTTSPRFWAHTRLPTLNLCDAWTPRHEIIVPHPLPIPALHNLQTSAAIDSLIG